ncbi:MAG TPA: hypothetical protein VGW80_11990 [Solirubrobacterales bacterium]|jgi:hypothetical protein|nr:hypothetical protein [Solirubrobacterales bacterium]
MVALAACGGAGGGETETEAATPAGKAELANFDGVHGGEVELEFQVFRFKKKQPEKQQEEITMRTVGSFMKAGEEGLPQLDLAIESNGELAGREVEFLSGPLLRADKWVVNFDGEVYEPDHATFEELKSKLEEAQQEEGGEGNAMACVESADGLSVTDLVHNISYEGKGEGIDGTPVEMLGGDFDPAAAIDELIQMVEASPGCQAQLEAIGLPSVPDLEAVQKELKASLAEPPRITFSLDKNGVARYFKILANLELPRSEELEFELVMRLNRINEVSNLPITHGYSPYSALLKQFGLDNEDVKQAEAGEIYVGILEVLADHLFGREAG